MKNCNGKATINALKIAILSVIARPCYCVCLVSRIVFCGIEESCCCWTETILCSASSKWFSCIICLTIQTRGAWMLLHSRRYTPLDYALLGGHSEVTQFMLEHGALSIAAIQDIAAASIQAVYKGYTVRKAFRERKQLLMRHEQLRKDAAKWASDSRWCSHWSLSCHSCGRRSAAAGRQRNLNATSNSLVFIWGLIVSLTEASQSKHFFESMLRCVFMWIFTGV